MCIWSTIKVCASLVIESNSCEEGLLSKFEPLPLKTSGHDDQVPLDRMSLHGAQALSWPASFLICMARPWCLSQGYVNRKLCRHFALSSLVLLLGSLWLTLHEL